jgi:hypothetical protein
LCNLTLILIVHVGTLRVEGLLAHLWLWMAFWKHSLKFLCNVLPEWQKRHSTKPRVTHIIHSSSVNIFFVPEEVSILFSLVNASHKSWQLFTFSDFVFPKKHVQKSTVLKVNSFFWYWKRVEILTRFFGLGFEAAFFWCGWDNHRFFWSRFILASWSLCRSGPVCGIWELLKCRVLGRANFEGVLYPKSLFFVKKNIPSSSERKKITTECSKCLKNHKSGHFPHRTSPNSNCAERSRRGGRSSEARRSSRRQR